jgi:hypothetical protein
MTTDIEMLRVAKDPAAVRSLAKRLLAIPSQDWSEWEVDFLEGKAKFTGPDPLTMRQREVLFELRDDAEYVTHHRGLSIAILIERCFLGRDDLDERSAEFIESIRGKTSIQRRKLGWFLSCCYRLGEIEPHMAR